MSHTNTRAVMHTITPTDEAKIYLSQQQLLNILGITSSDAVLHHPEKSGHTPSPTPRALETRGAKKLASTGDA